MSKLKTRYLFLIFMAFSLALTGCQTTARQDSTLTQADMAGPPNPADPMQAHLVARQLVNPKDTSSTHKYTMTEQEFAEEELLAHEKQKTNVRLAQLENQVEDLHRDFKQLRPSISEANAHALAAVETLNQIAEAPPESLQPQNIMPASGTASAVTKVRIGEHPGKTRIVLDLSAPGAYTANVDNSRKLLSIALPQSAWSTAMQDSLAGSPLVKGYQVSQAPSGGITLDISLKVPARLLFNEALSPNETYGNRIAFDVAPL